jgi:chromosome segregation ATPase
MKEKSMDNILESLNESLVKDNVEHLNDSLMNLHRENITITKKLEVSMRKNDELEKALSRQALELRNSNVLAASQHSGTKSTRVEIVKIPNSPNNVQSMYVDGSPDVHRLGVEVAELRRANDKLSNENAKLLVARNNEASRCQNLQGEISCLKEEMASINLDKSRAQHTMIVETSEIQRLRT